MTRELRIDHDRPDEETGDESYESWIANFEERDPEMIAGKLAQFKQPPVISIVVPVYRTNPDFLKRAIESVLAQSYPHQLCATISGSGSESCSTLQPADPEFEPFRDMRGHLGGFEYGAELAWGRPGLTTTTNWRRTHCSTPRRQ